MKTNRTIRFKVGLAQTGPPFLVLSGMLVVVKEHPTFLFVAHKASREDGGGWAVSEYTTGLRATPGNLPSAKSAVDYLKKHIKRVGEPLLLKSITSHVAINSVDDVRKKAYKLGYKD